MEGRPVYVKSVGQERHYLLVVEGQSTWSIRSSLEDKTAYLESGRGTNSPGDPAAGPSVRLGVSSWRFWNFLFNFKLKGGGGWQEGEITVTCN